MITNLILALILTILIESAVAFAMNYRGKQFFIILILVNIITNPIVNMIFNTNLLFQVIPIFTLEIILELLVVLSEYLLFVYSFPRLGKKKLFILSLSINIASYLFGILFSRFVL